MKRKCFEVATMLSKRAKIVKNALESHQRVISKTIAQYGHPNDRRNEVIVSQLKAEYTETVNMLQEIAVNGTLMYIKEKSHD